MRLRELYRLSHREFTAYRTRSRTTVITIGILFGILLSIVIMFQGLENVALKYAEYTAENLPDESTSDGISPYEKVQNYFQINDNKFVRPASVVLLIASTFILAFTMAHLLSTSTRTFVLYYSIGASKKQLLLIYLFYLLEICVRAAIFAIIVALIIAAIVTAVSWNYVLKLMAANFPGTPDFHPILVGVNLKFVGIICSMFFIAPLSFLLCLDQFSYKKLAIKLKGD